MAFLALNGVTVRVALDSVSMRYVEAGGMEERSPSGSLEGGPLVLKREWAMATTPVLASELDAWVGLIEGKGHSWPYDDDLYSARGRGPFYSFGSALVVGGAKHGTSYLRTGSGDDVAYSIGLPSAWTVLLWRRESGVWLHYGVNALLEGTWANGAFTGGPDSADFLNVSTDGELRVGDLSSDGLRDFDDVVALPYTVPDAWFPLMYAAHNAAAWSALPQVTAAGDFASSAVTVRGKVTDTRAIRYAPSGTPTTGYTIQFTLREV